MNPEKLNPAVKKAFDFIKTNLDKGVWRQGERLPSTRILAAHAGVSFVTMIRAVAALRTQGFISGVPRSRIRAGDGSSANIPAAHPDHAIWRMKRAAIEKDILTGVYAHQGKLPSIKELGARYGTCFRTMRKILRSMVEDNVINLRGKAHELQNVPQRPFSYRIVFITYQVPTFPRSALNQGHYQVLALFERECIHQKLKLDVAEIDFYNSTEALRTIKSEAIANPALGYVLDLWWFPNESYRKLHIDLLARLALLKRPVAILDEIGTFTLPMPFAANPLFQVFRIEGKKAGARIARLLLGLGHSSVAYISSQHMNAYSQQRLEGVQDQFAKAGITNGVYTAITDRIEIGLLHLLDISGFEESVIRKVVKAGGRTESQAQDQWKAWLEFKEQKKPKLVTGQDSRMLKKNLAGIRDLAIRDLDPGYFDAMCLAALTKSGTQLSQMILSPLFEEALKHQDVTAWICVSDGTAIAALEFLRIRNIPVPARISITGFDNEPVDAVTQRLTSFDFNAPGFIHSMLNFIARPPMPRGPYRHAPIEVEGMVMPRGTTAPPITLQSTAPA